MTQRILSIAMLALLACGKGGGETKAARGDIDLALAGSDGATTLKSGFIDSSGGEPTRKTHLVVLTSFELSEAGKDLGPALTAADQTKVTLNLIVQDPSGNTDLKPGTYVFNRSMTGLTLGTFRVYTFAGAEQQWARMGGAEGSSVTIKSVSADAIAGELHLIDGPEHATGAFTVKLKK